MPPELLGPAGALVGAVAIIVILWRDHQRADQDDRTQRDQAFAIAHAQVEATNRVADSAAGIAADLGAVAGELGRVRAELADARRDLAAMRRDMATRRRTDA